MTPPLRSLAPWIAPVLRLASPAAVLAVYVALHIRPAMTVAAVAWTVLSNAWTEVRLDRSRTAAIEYEAARADRWFSRHVVALDALDAHPGEVAAAVYDRLRELDAARSTEAN